MATKKQMTETIQRVDIIEDNMLKMEDNLGLLKEMIMMQNKHIESMMQLIIKNSEDNKKVEPKQLQEINPEENQFNQQIDNTKNEKRKPVLNFARRII